MHAHSRAATDAEQDDASPAKGRCLHLGSHLSSSEDDSQQDSYQTQDRSPEHEQPSTMPTRKSAEYSLKPSPGIHTPSSDRDLQELQESPRTALERFAAGTRSIRDMVADIKRGAIIKCRPVRAAHPPAENVCLVGQQSGRIKWIQPSGPRRPGEGTEDEAQGIVDAQETNTGGVLLRITLLASGFVIGPSGFTVREIIKATDADIKSWTDSGQESSTRPTRTFIIEGPQESAAMALSIICDAVERYKELCQYVPRIQVIRGICFSYQPPPRTIVPHAASLKGQGSRIRAACGGGSGRMRLSPQNSAAANQVASRILADVKNCLSGQYQRSSDGHGSHTPGRSSSPGPQHAWQPQASRLSDPARAALFTQAPTHYQHHQAPQVLLQQQAHPGRNPIALGPSGAPTPPMLVAAQGGAYEIVGGGTEGAAIPPGYALVPPNFLVPLSSLQTSMAAAHQPTQGYVMVPAQKYGGTMEVTPQYLDASRFAPQTPMLPDNNAYGRAMQTPPSYIGELSQLNLASGGAGNWAQQGTALEFSTPPLRNNTLQSILGLRSSGLVDQQDAHFSMQPHLQAAPTGGPPSSGSAAAGSRPGTPFKDFFNQLLNERSPQGHADMHQSPSCPAGLDRQLAPQQRQQPGSAATSLFSAHQAGRTMSGTCLAGGATHGGVPSHNVAAAGIVASSAPVEWRQDPGSPFGMLPAAAVNAPEWVPAAAAQSASGLLASASAPWVHGDHPLFAGMSYVPGAS